MFAGLSRSLLGRFALVLFCATAACAHAQPAIITDKADHPPTSTALISATGFQAGETVHLQVLRIDASARCHLNRTDACRSEPQASPAGLNAFKPTPTS